MRFRFRAEQQTGYRMREITSPGIYQVLLSQNHRPPPTAHPVRAPKSGGTRAFAAYHRRLSDKRTAAK